MFICFQWYSDKIILSLCIYYILGGSGSKEYACNAIDPVSIPELGKSPGEANGYPLQYFCLENSMDRGTWQATVHGVAELDMDTTEQLTLSLFFVYFYAYMISCIACSYAHHFKMVWKSTQQNFSVITFKKKSILR